MLMTQQHRSTTAHEKAYASGGNAHEMRERVALCVNRKLKDAYYSTIQSSTVPLSVEKLQPILNSLRLSPAYSAA